MWEALPPTLEENKSFQGPENMLYAFILVGFAQTAAVDRVFSLVFFCAILQVGVLYFCVIYEDFASF